MKRPHILFLSDHLGHGEGRIHGATSYFLTVLPQLHKRGYPLTVCFLRGRHPTADKLEAQGISPLFLNRPKWDFSVIRFLQRCIRENGIDLVHAAGMKGILTGAAAAHFTRTPCIAHLHDMLPQPAPVRFLQTRAAKWTAATIAISQAVKAFGVSDLHIPQEKLHVIPNGMNLTPFQVPARSQQQADLKASLGIPPQARIIITVGRLDAVKQQSEAILAMRGIRAAVPDAHLLLVGDGPLRNEYTELARREACPVTFAGQREDIPALLAISDVMLISSRSEGLGLSAIEALAAGIPVVCPRVGGLPEVVRDHVCGILTAPDSRAEQEAAIMQLLQDEPMRQRYAAAARKQAANFGIDHHMSLLETLYNTVMQETHAWDS